MPIAAAGLIARKQLKLPSERLAPARRVPETPGQGAVPPSSLSSLSAAALPAPATPFDQFAAYAIDQHKLGLAGEKRDSVIMAPDSTLGDPTVVPCDQRPSAVMVDADLQSGGKRLSAALGKVRAEGLRVLWVLDDREDASVAPSALGQAGFTPGDEVLAARNANQRKQLVRQLATIDHCIVAVAGARRGDMDELYDFLKDKATDVPSDVLWNQGWFLIPAAEQPRPTTKGTP